MRNALVYISLEFRRKLINIEDHIEEMIKIEPILIVDEKRKVN